MWHSPSNSRRSTSSSRHSALVSTLKFSRPFEHADMMARVLLQLRQWLATTSPYSHSEYIPTSWQAGRRSALASHVRHQCINSATTAIGGTRCPVYRKSTRTVVSCKWYILYRMHFIPSKTPPSRFSAHRCGSSPIRLGVAPVLSLLRRQVQQL